MTEMTEMTEITGTTVTIVMTNSNAGAMKIMLNFQERIFAM